jgi:CHAT domain-containing protein
MKFAAVFTALPLALLLVLANASAADVPHDRQQAARAQREQAAVLLGQGAFTRAAPLLASSLQVLEPTLDAGGDELARHLELLARARYGEGRFAESEGLLQRALGMRSQRHGEKSPEAAGSLHELGVVLGEMGKYELSDQYFGRALAIRESVFGAQGLPVAQTLNAMAVRLLARGRVNEAEALWQRALVILEAHGGTDHPDVGLILSNLGSVTSRRGRLDLAIPLFERAAATIEKVSGPEHPDLASALNNLAVAHAQDGKPDLAEPLMRRALAIQQKARGDNHPEVSLAMQNLAGVFADVGRMEEAIVLYRQSLVIDERVLGPDHPSLAEGLINLAVQLDFDAGSEGAAEAERLFDRALDIQTRALGPGHPEVGRVLSEKSVFLTLSGRTEEAMVAVRRAKAIQAAHWRTVTSLQQRHAEDERRAMSEAMHGHLEIQARASGLDYDTPEEVAESFEFGQWANVSTVGATMAQVSARLSRGQDGLAKAIRARQDALESLVEAEEALLGAVSLPAAERDRAGEQALRAQIDRHRATVEQGSRELQQAFPRYGELTNPEPVPLVEAQTLLGEDEALVVYTISPRRVHAWVLRSTGAMAFLLKAKPDDVDSQVRFLRARLQPNANGELPAFTAATSSQLHAMVFAPLAAGLEGARRVFVVPDGALQSLPFSLLGSEGRWLAEKHAFAVLPSVGALRALRAAESAVVAPLPFAGFGAPDLLGSPTGLRNLDAKSIYGANGGKRALADVALLRLAPPLPETADELNALAKLLGAGNDSVFLSDQATEARIKSADLSRYRLLAFATHGITAGELEGWAEPGLVLTPPAAATDEDDGYLSASEVAQLELNADWVLLSACNTAAPDGAPGAEGLTGLAQGFFYAGARSLLVSNWAVASGSTRDLVIATVSRYAANPEAGKPEALQAAMLDMLSRPDTAHPFHWAPFSVVGE